MIFGLESEIELTPASYCRCLSNLTERIRDESAMKTDESRSFFCSLREEARARIDRYISSASKCFRASKRTRCKRKVDIADALRQSRP